MEYNVLAKVYSWYDSLLSPCNVLVNAFCVLRSAFCVLCSVLCVLRLRVVLAQWILLCLNSKKR